MTIQAVYRGKMGRREADRLSAAPAHPVDPVVRKKLREVEQAAADSTDAVWEERILAVRSAYVASCRGLGGALEELERALCLVTGEQLAVRGAAPNAPRHAPRSAPSVRRGPGARHRGSGCVGSWGGCVGLWRGSATRKTR